MAYEIVWLPKAEERFDEILLYLERNWEEKVIRSFIQNTEEKLAQVKQRPKMFRRSPSKNIHEVLITKHNLLLYRIKGNKIELLTFFDTRQNPKKKYKF